MWFSPPLFGKFPYTLGFPYLRVHVYVVWSMKNLDFTQKMDKRLREKKKHLRLNIPFSGFSYGNSLYISFASRRTYCYMVSALNSLYNAMKIFWLKSSRISYFYKNVELTFKLWWSIVATFSVEYEICVQTMTFESI